MNLFRTQEDLDLLHSQHGFDKLLDHLVDCNTNYHMDGTSPLTDTQYDLLYDYLKEIQPNHDFFDASVVGSNVFNHEKSKVRLPIFMGSMNKIKEIKHVEAWKSKYVTNEENNIIISAKLDGISALLDCRDSPKLYTRGNGIVGRDISYLIPYLGIPKEVLVQNVMIRGEIIMKKDIFEKHYMEHSSNSRNLVAGIVNQNYIDYDALKERNKYKDMEFVAYNVYFPNNLSLYQQLVFIQKHGLACTWWQSFKSDNWDHDLNDYLYKLKTSYVYTIDGIIVSESKSIHSEMYDVNKRENPKWAFAYKNPNIVETKQTSVIEVLWNASKDKYLKPKIKLREVVCDGSKVNYVTGFNAKYIHDNKLGPGSIVEIGLSGGVIPHIFKILAPSQKGVGSLPDKILVGEYVWNDNGVDIVLSKETREVLFRKALLFMKSFEIKALGEGTLKNLFLDDRITSISDILKLSKDDWITFPRIGTKKADSIMSSMVQAIENGDVIQYMYGSQVFDRNLGQTKLKSILFEIAKSSKPLLLNLWNNTKIKNDHHKHYHRILLGCPGISSKSAIVFLERIQDFNNWMMSLRANVTNMNIPRIDHLYASFYERFDYEIEDQEYIGNVVLSGLRFTEPEFGHTLMKMKLKLHDGGVNNFTKFLIVRNMDSESSKVNRAKDKGIPIMTLNDFMSTFG
jgi:DNA ligase (NAD+)